MKTILHSLAAAGLLPLLFAAGQSPAQIPVQTELEQQIELFTEKNEDEKDFTEFAEELESLRTNPVNLNSRNPEELQRLFFLNPRQLHRLLAYTSTYGDFLTLYELKAVEGLDSATIQRMLPYVVIKPPEDTLPGLRHMISYGRHTFLGRYSRLLQTREGYLPATDSLLETMPDSRYKGTPGRNLMKYSFDYKGRLRWGLLGDKDPGEEFFGGSNKTGFDFYSGFVYYRDQGWVKRLVLGDFHATFGQGLVMWSGFSFGKSGWDGGMLRSARGLTPSTSASEVNFLRGGGITLGFKNLELTAFGSKVSLDASPGLCDSTNCMIKSLQTTGLHRTASEIENRGRVTLTSAGANITFAGLWYKLGLTAVRAHYSKAFEPKKELYNKFRQPLQDQFTTGAEVRLFLRRTLLGGEIARDRNGHWAGILNLTLKPDNRFLLSLIYRNYDKAFQNDFSQAFGENTGNYNEEGIFFAVSAQPSRLLDLSAYADHYRFPWLRYRADAPSIGREYYLRTLLNLNRASTLGFRYRFEEKPVNCNAAGRKVNILFPSCMHSFRLFAAHQPLPEWEIASRTELVLKKSTNGEYRQGFLIFWDLKYQPQRFPFTLSARYALFDTETYDERIYAYESDVLYSFSVPAYYDAGQRVYIMLKYSMGDGLDLWFRCATTWYSDLEEIGSGTEKITGNVKSDISAQFILKL